jgi:hypothetical protein
MCRIRNYHPLDLGNLLEKGHLYAVYSLIVLSVYNQRRHYDLVQPAYRRLVLQQT